MKTRLLIISIKGGIGGLYVRKLLQLVNMFSWRGKISKQAGAARFITWPRLIRQLLPAKGFLVPSLFQFVEEP
jgi:hypothetical protein